MESIGVLFPSFDATDCPWNCEQATPVSQPPGFIGAYKTGQCSNYEMTANSWSTCLVTWRYRQEGYDLVDSPEVWPRPFFLNSVTWVPDSISKARLYRVRLVAAWWDIHGIFMFTLSFGKALWGDSVTYPAGRFCRRSWLPTSQYQLLLFHYCKLKLTPLWHAARIDPQPYSNPSEPDQYSWYASRVR